MKIYNAKHLDNNARWTQAILYGVLAMIGISIVYAIIGNLMRSVSSVLFVLNALVISYVVKTYGRGVGVKFRYLALGLTIGSIFLSQLFLYFGLSVIFNPLVVIQGSFRILGNLISLNDPISLLFNIVFIGYACQYSFNNGTIL